MSKTKAIKKPTMPGDFLLAKLKTHKMSQAELSRRSGLHAKTINEIIKGKAPISYMTAIYFERCLGVPAHEWNTLQLNWRVYLLESNLKSKKK